MSELTDVISILLEYCSDLDDVSSLMSVENWRARDLEEGKSEVDQSSVNSEEEVSGSSDFSSGETEGRRLEQSIIQLDFSDEVKTKAKQLLVSEGKGLTGTNNSDNIKRKEIYYEVEELIKSQNQGNVGEIHIYHTLIVLLFVFYLAERNYALCFSIDFFKFLAQKIFQKYPYLLKILRFFWFIA